MPLERALCTHFLTAGLDPKTSSCANLCTYDIYILVIYTYICVLLKNILSVMPLAGFHPAKPSCSEQGVDQSQPKPTTLLCKQRVPTEQSKGPEGTRAASPLPLCGGVCRTAVPQRCSHPHSGREMSPRFAGFLGEGLHSFK